MCDPFLLKLLEKNAGKKFRRKAQKRPWNTSNKRSKLAQIEGIFLKINYRIRGRRYWKHQCLTAKSLYV